MFKPLLDCFRKQADKITIQKIVAYLNFSTHSWFKKNHGFFGMFMCPNQ